MSIAYEPDHVEPITHSAQTIPRYIQIAEQLIARIQAGELAPGDRLPPERDLSKQLSVSRLTLRQAFGVLKIRGLIVQRQGDGTYIAARKIDRAAGRLWPFSKSMRHLGYAPTARVLLLDQRPSNVDIAEQLALAPGTPVYYCHRLRLIGDEPVLLEQFALPAACFAGLEQYDLASRSVYEIMEHEYQVVVAHARQILEPVVATPYEAELLSIDLGAPLMLEQRITFDRQGSPIECSRDLYRGDRFRFVTDMATIEGDEQMRDQSRHVGEYG